jgi:ligand-binding sensor domain-containing protein/signal transduction histidine kinase
MVLALLLCLAMVGTSRGEVREFVTQVWTVGDGLPDNSVTSIAQTPDGYLWVGTINGLARFDGVRFVTFNPENTPALKHARVDKLFLDKQGTLWINTFDGSLASLRQGDFNFDWPSNVPASQDVTLVNSSSNNIIFAQVRGDFLCKRLGTPATAGWEEMARPDPHLRFLNYGDGECVVWQFDSGKHIWRLDGGEFKPTPEALHLGGQRIKCLVTDRTGRWWVGTDKEIAVWDGTQFQTVTPTNGESQVDVDLLVASEDGSVWSVANKRLRKSVGRCWIAEAKPTQSVFTGSSARTTAADDHHGGLWLYGYGQGLLHVSADGQVRQFDARDGFPAGRVNCLFEDREGDWWAGLEAGGLVRVRARQFLALPSTERFFAPAAKSVCEDASGNLWVATLGGGLNCWRDGVSTNLTLPSGPTKDFFFSVYPDATGRLWTSAGEEDLFVLDREEFRQITPLVHGVKAILSDRFGRVWVGTTAGLFAADTRASGNFKLIDGTAQQLVRALVEGYDGSIWIGSGDGTIFRFADEKLTSFHPPGGGKSEAVLALLAESDGTIWAGTFRNGLLRFRDGQFARFTRKDGLPDNVISQILADDLGNLWLGSHQGVFRVAKSALDEFSLGHTKTISCTVYGRSDGLPSLECSSGYQPAAWRAKDGKLWFTTAKGAVSVQPHEIRPNLPPPPVLIEEVVVDGKILIPKLQTNKGAGKGDGGYTPHAARFVPLEIGPGNHRVEFHYTGLSLASPDQVQFRYRLEGADRDWIWAGPQRSIEYSLLPAGDYHFQVLACNSDNIWSEEPCTLNLRILPHFYNTLWFRVLAGILVAGLIAGTVKHRVTLKLRRKMEKLERQRGIERERARIARDIHDDLGSSLTLIAALGDFVSREKADDRLGKISFTARQAVKSLDEIVWAVNPRNDTLGHLIDYAGQFAVDYLRGVGIRCLLDVPQQMPAQELPSNVRHNVFLVIKESMQNIVKHAKATEVWLRFGLTAEGVRIVIEDDGIGFDQVPDNALADGLRNMRQRMSEIGGQCQIESRIGMGSSIILQFSQMPS